MILKNKSYNYLTRDNENIFLIENYDQIKSLIFEYTYSNINAGVALENSIINSEYNNSIQFYSKAKYGKNYINLKYIYNDSNIAFINQYFNLKMFLSPNLFWTEKYRFFMDLNFFYYRTFNNNTYDPNELYYFTNLNNVYNDYFFNNGFGLIVDNFKITYCTNFISINDFYISDTYLPIKPISFFKIDWIFQD